MNLMKRILSWFVDEPVVKKRRKKRKKNYAPRPRYTEEEVNRIYKLFDAGKMVSQIAKIMGKSDSNIHAWLNKRPKPEIKKPEPESRGKITVVVEKPNQPVKYKILADAIKSGMTVEDIEAKFKVNRHRISNVKYIMKKKEAHEKRNSNTTRTRKVLSSK